MNAFGSRRYEVKHATRYTYGDLVDYCYNRAYIFARETPYQHVIAQQIQTSPPARYLHTKTDYFGNLATYIELDGGTPALEVTSVNTVEVNRRPPDLETLSHYTLATAIREAERQLTGIEFAEFTLPSPLVRLSSLLRHYAESLIGADLGLPAALVELMSRIYGDFNYRQGMTSVRTTLDEVLQTKAGVCQDFAHLAIGVLRSLQLPARYVSGYIETTPPKGKPKLQGADATHAWLSVYTPTGWLDLDPTNNQFADSRYIVTAWGRDFSDVSPLRGVVLTESETSELSVEVNVTSLPRPK
ncbi:MAG: transglutaminase family protein [Propionibacteriaceae bacterium]|jgi:transglutaminase-like putative cysteine protease|nr:transglutaminase family protein [Propionibacteriaceae bacterium]